MSSDSEQESLNLKARLKAKLQQAGVCDTDSSSDEDNSTSKNSLAKSASKPILKSSNIKKAGGSTNSQSSDLQASTPNHNPKSKKVAHIPSPSTSESDVASSHSKKKSSRNLVAEDSDSDASDIIQPTTSFKRHPNISSGSDGDESDNEAGSDVAQSSESEEEDDLSDIVDSADDIEEEENSEACSLIDNEAEEVDGSASGSAEDDDLGETISSSSSEWESDWISEADEPSTITSASAPENVSSSQKVASSSGFASDSSDDSSEKCPICLSSFKSKEVGTPESCDHIFCAECIEHWSKNVNTCPVDRQEFTLILVRRKIGGKVVKQIPVQRLEPKEEEDEDPTYCEVCGNCDREDRMLLCDGCDLGYHMECLDPPLTHVPLENWYCSECAHNDSNTPLAEVVDFGIDEVNELLRDARNVGTPQARRPTRIQPFARTRQFERFLGQTRRVLNRMRQRTHEALEALRSLPSTSSGIDSQSSNTTRRKRKAVRRKTVSKKRRKTTKRTTKKASKKTSTTSVKGTSKKKSVGKKRKAKKTISSKSKKKKVGPDSSFIVADMTEDMDPDYSP